MIYKTYTLWVSFDDGETSKMFQVVAVSVEAALQDIEEARGEFILLSQDTGR